MKNNCFKSIRKSYIVCTFLTTFLSSSIVLGQPIAQTYRAIIIAKQQLAIPYGSEYSPNNPLYQAKRTDTNSLNSVPSIVNSTSHPRDNFKKAGSKALVFEPKEGSVAVGKSMNSNYDNPFDNYLTITLPDSLDINAFDAVLSYSLFGLEEASHTTKSINGKPSYGGMVVKKNNVWSSVEEKLPSQQLKSGVNEIYFTRRSDIDYEYQITDIVLQLKPRTTTPISLINNSIKNYNGNGYLIGYVNDTNINAIVFNNDTIRINDGVFEGILQNIPSAKNLELKYITEEGNLNIESVESVWQPADYDYLFRNTEDISPSIQLTLEECEAEYGALIFTGEEASKITTRGLLFKDMKVLNSGLVNVTSGKYPGYRIYSLSESDNTPVKIHLGYDVEKIPAGYSPKDIRTFFYDVSTKQWKMLPVDSLDYSTKKIITYFTGDTDYINGIIKAPETPETAGFTPTSINGMATADPSSGVVSIAPPTPSSSGSASTSFPLKLPPGRNGVQPSLNINYNSEGGNGWMGIGWNLQLPAITINTKWGTPIFDPVNETEMYSLNGEDLVFKLGTYSYQNPHRSSTNITRNTVNTRRLYPRIEGNYDQIVRYGTTPSDYYWMVRDKYGNRNYYGGSTGVDENAVIRDEAGNIVHWALCKTIDTNGNFIEYTYYNTTDTSVLETTEENATVKTHNFYPLQIRYTLKGTTTTQSYYIVQFKRNTYTVGDATQALSRKDVALNGRNGALMYTKDLLTEVSVQMHKNGGPADEIVRTYRFDYEEMAFEKNQLIRISEYDAGGNLFYSNTMEYYSDIDYNTAIGTNPTLSLFNSSSNDVWDAGNDIVNVPFLNYVNQLVPSFVTGLVLPHVSSLGTSSSSGYTIGLRAGLGWDLNVKSKQGSVGITGNYSKNVSKTLITLQDINGDGLPDKIFEGVDGIEYKLNKGDIDNTGSKFGGKYDLEGISSLSKTDSRTLSGQLDVTYYAMLAANINGSKNKTVGYFSDMNGDGLDDYVKNGKIYFNTGKNNASDNIRKFIENVNSTENAINGSAIDLELISDMDFETLDELREQFPQYDVVKVWEAPYSGNISINADASVVSENIVATEDCPSGVDCTNTFKFSIEKSASGNTGNASYLETTPFNLTSGGSYTISPINITVSKGDFIFFRVHNTGYGTGGKIKFDPEITYTNIPSLSSLNFTDENGAQWKDFDCNSQYIVSNDSYFNQRGSHTINFNLPVFADHDFTDDIIYKVRKLRVFNNGDPTVVFGPEITRTYNHKTGFNSSSNTENITLDFHDNDSEDENQDNSYYDVLEFRVESTSNIEWEAINWQPMVITSSETIYPEVKYVYYNDNFNQFTNRIGIGQLPEADIQPDPTPEDPDHDTGDETLINISCNLNMGSNSYSDFDDIESSEFPIPIYFVVKKESLSGEVEVFDRKTIYLNRTDILDTEGNPTGDYTYNISPSNPEDIHLTRQNVADLTDGNSYGNLYIGLYSPISKIADVFSSSNITLASPSGITTIPTEWPIVKSNPFFVNKSNFSGTPYKGWGQFLYNGGLKENTDYGNSPIDMGVFGGDSGQYGNFDTDNPESIDSPEALIGDNQNPDDLQFDNVETAPRYAFFSADNQNLRYYSDAIVYNYDEETDEYTGLVHGPDIAGGPLYFSMGRFGESNIYNLFVDTNDLVNVGYHGLDIYSKSKGTGVTASYTWGYGENQSSSAQSHGNTALEADEYLGTTTSGSFTYSWSDSDIINQYVDLNGDRYPDLLTSNKVQYTLPNGSYMSAQSNPLISKSKSWGVTIGVNQNIPNINVPKQANKTTPSSGSSSSPPDQSKAPAPLDMGVGVSGSFGASTDTYMWADLNGDGLTDKVRIDDDKVFVSLNTGYIFSEEIVWGDIPKDKTSANENYDITASLSGIPIPYWKDKYANIVAGVGIKKSLSRRRSMLLDINSDGLQDWVTVIRDGGNNKCVYQLNTGKNFSSQEVKFFDDQNLDTDTSFGGGTNYSYPSEQVHRFP